MPRLLALAGTGLERSEEVDSAINTALADSGARVNTAELQQIISYFAAWETILHCEASAYHARLLKENPNGFSPVTRAHLEAGNEISAVEYLKAQSVRAHFTDLLLNKLPDWDALVLPTLPVVAPKYGEDWQDFGGRRVTTQDSLTWFCWLGNLAGLPSITIPLTGSSGLPVGLMLMGKPGRDEELLAVARFVDQHMRRGEAFEQ